jgi:hypothetical protein
MKQKNKPDSEPHVPVIVKLEIEVEEGDAFWLCIQGEANGITPQRVASRIVRDVIRDDMLMMHEEDNVTMH